MHYLDTKLEELSALAQLVSHTFTQSWGNQSATSKQKDDAKMMVKEMLSLFKDDVASSIGEVKVNLNYSGWTDTNNDDQPTMYSTIKIDLLGKKEEDLSQNLSEEQKNTLEEMQESVKESFRDIFGNDDITVKV